MIGSIHKDIHKSEITHDAIHAYTDAGIAQLLSDVYKLANDAEYRGDTEAIVLKVDLERALRSECMSPKQRQSVALYYMCQISKEECAKLLNVTRQAIDQRLINAATNISQHMQGEPLASSQHIHYNVYTNIYPGFDVWMTQVLVGDGDWWSIPDNVLDSLNRVLGMLPESSESENNCVEYPYLTDGQLRGRNRNREILRPEVYPTDGNRGYVKSGEDGRRVRLAKFV